MLDFMNRHIERQNARLTAQLGAQFAESDRLEAQIKTNLASREYVLGD